MKAAATQLTMPRLSDSMEEATIVRWLKSPGEAFTRGEALAEIETDKATVVYEAESDGVLGAILVPEGEVAALGSPIALLANGDQAEPEEPETAAVDVVPGDGRRPAVTPVARRTAVELGVSLHGLTGTGPGGRITLEDVQAAAEQVDGPIAPPATSPKGATEQVELTPTQATIARRMAESAATVPTFTVSADIDMSAATALRREARTRSEVVPSMNDFVVKAVALTLRELPSFNASFVDRKIVRYSRINVGIAVATDDALLVPAVVDADLKTLQEIARETRRLAAGARARTLLPDELTQATFTVSNLGMFGIRSFTAIVDLPQVAILAVGAVTRRPFEGESGEVEFREAMTVTLCCDHRVVYGADGARFLARLRELLESPLALSSS